MRLSSLQPNFSSRIIGRRGPPRNGENPRGIFSVTRRWKISIPLNRDPVTSYKRYNSVYYDLKRSMTVVIDSVRSAGLNADDSLIILSIIRASDRSPLLTSDHSFVTADCAHRWLSIYLLRWQTVFIWFLYAKPVQTPFNYGTRLFILSCICHASRCGILRTCNWGLHAAFNDL